MSQVAVVYWSGTGHTEAMAQAVAAAAQADLFTAAEFDADKAANYAAIAFGCPSMGAEQLEDSEFEPMFEAVKPSLAGKKVALFGSYGWGGGEWMRTWESDCAAAGITLCRRERHLPGRAGRRGAGRLRRAGRSFEVISKNGRAMRVHQPVDKKGTFGSRKYPFTIINSFSSRQRRPFLSFQVASFLDSWTQIRG